MSAWHQDQDQPKKGKGWATPVLCFHAFSSLSSQRQAHCKASVRQHWAPQEVGSQERGLQIWQRQEIQRGALAANAAWWASTSGLAPWRHGRQQAMWCIMIARAVGLLHAPRAAACFADHTSRYVTPSDCHVVPPDTNLIFLILVTPKQKQTKYIIVDNILLQYIVIRRHHKRFRPDAYQGSSPLKTFF